TSPAAREWVEVGTTVTCYVSLGKSNESTAVPQMVNLSLASAEARAKEYDIILTVTYEPSSEVAEGKVIRQSIEPTTIVEKNTIVEIVVSDGGEPVRESSISITVNQNATGEFEFKYYIDGTRQDDMTEIKDLALTQKIEWKFSNSGVHDYAIRVRSTATGAEGLFLNMSIDFTTDPPTKTPTETNERVFRQLLSAAPTQPEDTGEPSGEETTAPEEDEPIPEETDDPYAEDPDLYGENGEGTEGD
ncbi:MAG: PASTA domain-containing protein, partial [Ruminiclostridium sp.]|nr:PASTA domain-containing protein [Ruminiclostridium sp.]